MAFADLSFTAALWRGRGLRWLTAATDLPPELSLTAEPAPPAPAVARSVKGAPPGGPRQARAPGPSSRPAQEARRPAQGSGAPTAGGSPRWRPLKPETLPPGWQGRLSSTRRGLVAWTYWDLARDLGAGGGDGATDAGAQARAGRRAFLARLLRELAHPAGTHTFWPACLPAGAQPGAPPAGEAVPFMAHPEAFWSGAAHLGCRAVIVMGSAAVRALGLPAELRPLGQMRWRGQLVLVLREVDALAAEPARFGPTLAFLRQALGPVVTFAR